MKKRKLISMVLAATLALTSLTGCGKKDSSSDDSVLRVGMECAYAPFNWPQETDELANGEKAVPIYGTNMYAYGYDVIVAEKLAKQMGKTLEIHKVEWDSIGMSLDAGDYDVIIAGMGRTKEREASYSFTDPYYYRTNCLVVKKGSGLEGIKGLSELAGKNVTLTTQLGTGWVNLLDQVPDATLGANYETTAECFMAISNGTAANASTGNTRCGSDAFVRFAWTVSTATPVTSEPVPQVVGIVTTGSAFVCATFSYR